MKYHDTGSEIGIAILLFILALVIALLFAWIGMALWNTIMVGIFGLPALTYWQFYGLMVLLHILFPSGGTRIKKEN